MRTIGTRGIGVAGGTRGRASRAPRALAALAAIIGVGAALFGAALAGAAPAAPAAGSPARELIPLETLTAPPRLWNPLISPDGTRISYVALRDGAPNLWVAPAHRFDEAMPVTAAGGQGVTTSNVAGYSVYRWTADSRRLLYLQDQNGDERWHLMVTDVASGATRDLTPFGNVQARLVAVSEQRPDEALVEINDRRPDRHDLYRVRLDTGARTLVYRNDRFIGIFADNQLRARLAVAVSEDGGFDVFKAAGQSAADAQAPEWAPFFHLRQADTSALIRAVEQNAWNFSADNRRFRIYDSRGRDTWSLVEIDLDSGKTRSLAHDDRVDIDSALYDGSGEVSGWRAYYLRARWHSPSGAVQRLLTRLQRAHDGDLDIISRSRDATRWLVSYSPSARSPEFYIFEPRTDRLMRIAVQIPGLDALSLPQFRPVVIASRDGKPLVSYLALPAASAGRRVGAGPGLGAGPGAGAGRRVGAGPTAGAGAGAGAGRRAKLPMIVYVHGGPNDERAVLRYFSRLQWLADRGYAVLNVNYRGSPGFGKRFLNAQDLEWGRRMNLDVVDQARWAVRRGIADPQRIGIFGGSYGGYEVLAAMTKTPGVFACGAALAAPSDLESFIRVWWENFIPATNMAYKSIVLGDPDTPRGRAALYDESPIHFAQQARGSLLIAQGGEDTRVPVDQAQRMVDALRAAQVPVTYLVYPEEGHGVVRPGNRRSFYAITEAFFGHCLGGDYTPLSLQLDEANVRIPVGADLVPGLAQSYARQAPQH
jgi:dipeptidyl aminopeptidase/acylaminoacyl peptidase